MEIRNISFKRYRLSLKKPLNVKGRRLEYREGLIAVVKDSLGNTGYGEISPLPGFHRETLSQAAQQAEELAPGICGSSVDTLLSGMDKLSGGLAIFPSVRFGLEMSALNILYTGKDNRFGNRAGKDVPVNKLLSFDDDMTGENIDKIIEAGYSSVKLKLGQEDQKKDIRRLLRLRELLPDSITIRLDPNGSWSLKEAVAFFSETGRQQIEYVEDPVDDISRYGTFHDMTGIPVAVDQYLASYVLRYGFAGKGVKYMVLKPDLLGGFSRTLYYIEKAAENGVKPVLSHCFLSGLALVTIAVFASEQGLNLWPSGLDKPDWLEPDLLKTDYPISSGKVDFKKAVSSLNMINKDLLLT